jgi:NADH-quinone oxidoreductase subunit N
MNISLNTADLAALSPLWILLLAALSIILLECFIHKKNGKIFPYLAVSAFFVAFCAALVAPGSENPLLTPWLSFNKLALFFTLFFLIVGMATALLSASFFQRFENLLEISQGEYFFLLLSSIFGLILIGIAADFLTLFLGLETLSIALYVLCGYMKKWPHSAEAAIKYFLLGALATAFLLYGIALIYGAIGTTQFKSLLPGYHALHDTYGHALFLSGIGLVTVGFAFKAAIVPFHTWAPDAYDGAPNPVTALMAVGTKIGILAAFIRVFLISLSHFNPLWNQTFSLFVYATLIYANLIALKQIQFRRFFAYSGISQAGFLLIPLVGNTEDSVIAILFYLIMYACATFAAFAVLAFLDRNSEGVMIQDVRGLFYRAPWLAGILIISLLTLAGIPPTVGFFAKFYVFKVAYQSGYYGLIAVGLLTTILSAFYYLRIISLILSKQSEEKEKMIVFFSWPAGIVGGISLVAIILFSIYPEPLLRILNGDST